MDGIQSVASSADAVNQVLQMATEKQNDMAEKLMKANVETAVSSGKEAGKGMGIDLVA